jgi:hypothetical protein
MSAEIPSKLEPTSLIRQNERRPDGMSLSPWKNSGGVWLGISLVQKLLRPAISKLLSTDLVLLLAEVECKKSTKDTGLMPTFRFVPIAVETLGALGDGDDELMHDLGGRISEVTGKHQATEFLLQKLGVVIQR